MDQTRTRHALDMLPREAPSPPHVVELRGGADLARAARASDPACPLPSAKFCVHCLTC